jgi:hypothetical protein
MAASAAPDVLKQTQKLDEKMHENLTDLIGHMS